MGCLTRRAGEAASPGGSCALVWALPLTRLCWAPWAFLRAGDGGSFQAAGMLIASSSAHFEFYVFAWFFFFVFFSLFLAQTNLTFFFPSLISIPPCWT